jgi:hypothetical protein
MEEERKNREREEWGRVIKILFFGMDIPGVELVYET